MSFVTVYFKPNKTNRILRYGQQPLFSEAENPRSSTCLANCHMAQQLAALSSVVVHLSPTQDTDLVENRSESDNHMTLKSTTK